MTSKVSQGVSAGKPIRKRNLWHAVNPLRLLLFGRPIPTERQEHQKLPKIVALPVFASDPISSVAYATQQIILVLGAAGLWTLQHRATYTTLTLAITAGIVLLSVVVVTSYWQTIFAYPSGGGSYIVSKDNLGETAGLVAGAALLIDYVLTVSVSIASGVQNLLSTPVMAKFASSQVAFCVLFIALLTFANLRGLKESGTLFAFPTYFFVFMATLMVILGTFGPTFGWHIHADTVNQAVPPFAQAESRNLAGFALVLIVLKAFASGCVAMTGTEAVSNGIPAFRKPESRNAAITLVIMACILGFLFLGISWIATQLHVVYWEHGKQSAMPVIDQLSGSIFGKTGGTLRVTLYYCMQFSTTALLVLAANTSYADFPRLASIMAHDRFLPRQLMNRADKLVFANGIILLGIFATCLIFMFHGSVDKLIPLYAVGVFTAFTLSQVGMVRHWLKERGKGWQTKALINGVGATFTGTVLTIIAAEKGPEGAWVVIVVAAILFALFKAIARHYEYVRGRLSPTESAGAWLPESNLMLVLVPSVHQGVIHALKYAQSMSADVIAIHVEVNPDDTPKLRADWQKFIAEDIPLLILPSPYRSLIGPLMAYLDSVREVHPTHMVTMVVPEFVSDKWWHSLLHNANGLLVKFYLLSRRNVVVANVRYFLERDSEPSDRYATEHDVAALPVPTTSTQSPD
jgi:amino acid transporter